MKRGFTWWLLAVACGGQAMAAAQLQLLTNREPQQVFAGTARSVSITFSNASDEDFDAFLQMRIFQATSAMAAPADERPWKELRMLPRQTVLESASIDFPVVNAATKFLVQWFAGSNRVIGTTEVMAFPTNLLNELNSVFKENQIGVLDPNQALSPSLRNLPLGFLDLGEMSLDNFSGKLAIVGPFQSGAQMREGLTRSIQKIAIRGVAVIWIQPPPEPNGEIMPSFFIVPEGKGAVIVVQPELVADFSENPQSQSNFIRLCKLALKPEPFALPDLSSQP